MASKPAFCSPLKGVAAGAEALPQTCCSSVGELNQKPTLKVWTGENGLAGFSTNVSLSKMPTTLISATPAALLSISDWYQPKPKPLNPASRGECSTRNTSKPVFGGNPDGRAGERLAGQQARVDAELERTNCPGARYTRHRGGVCR